MQRKRLSRLFAALFVVLLIVNLYVFFTRDWESSYHPTSYATLYYSLDIPTIRKWNVVEPGRIQLDIACTNEVRRWTILTEGGNPQTGLGMKPSFWLDTTFNTVRSYTLIPEPVNACQPIEISLRYLSKEFYAERGMQHTDVYIIRSNVPCGEFEQVPVDYWVDDYTYVGEEGLLVADRILREEVGIRKEESTFERMEKLTRYLRIKLIDARGVPKDDERWMNPWMLYNEMVDGTGKGWCTQHAQVWVFWANRAGIPTRFVFGARTEDNTIIYTGHAWAESFIREQNKWAFVDLSHSNIYITDKNGDVLNSAQLFHLNQHNAFDSTFGRIYVDWEWEHLTDSLATDTIMTVPFNLCNQVVRSEYTPHSILKYRRPPNVEDVRALYTGFYKDWTFLTANLERYLFKPQLAYSFYPTEGKQTYLIRRLLFLGLVASLLFWLALGLPGWLGGGKAKKES
jgi:transglutaminase-like putative cysteine protease